MRSHIQITYSSCRIYCPKLQAADHGVHGLPYGGATRSHAHRGRTNEIGLQRGAMLTVEEQMKLDYY